MLNQLTEVYLDQSKDLVWMVDLEFQLIYANKSYLTFMKKRTGTERKLNESALVETLGKDDIEKWKAYYLRAFQLGYFEVEEHFYNESSGQIQYNHITFEPLTGDDNKVFAISCQSKDITRVIKQQSEASQLIDASLDVFCTVNAQGEFVYISAPVENHWGYTTEELIGLPYKNLVVEEDVSKTNKITEDIHKGKKVKSFSNRFRRKDGGIAYNLWSATWDETTQLMYAVARDVKEKIKQEEQILHSEQRF